MNIKELAHGYLKETIAIRRHIHKHPELSGHEVNTSGLVEKQLDQWSISYRRIPGNGVLGIIDSGKPGKTVGLRADMDALPIQEKSNAEYRSLVDGAAHVCGHDCHTASLLTAARILNEIKDSFPGKVHLIFQPAEEGKGCGADEMIEYGAMDGVDAVFGVHMLNDIEAGHVSVQEGPRMAASLRAFIEIKGRGGHGGTPHKCVDAIVTGSAVVMNLQTIASRELNTLDSAVISVGTFHGGTVFNAIAETVELGLTIKFFNPQLADKLAESITRIVENTVKAYRAECNIRIEAYLRPVINDKGLSTLAALSAKKILGDEGPVTCPPLSASEDYSSYLERAPGVFAFVGGRNESRGLIQPLHHPSFDVDEIALEVAPAIHAQFAVDFLTGVSPR